MAEPEKNDAVKGAKPAAVAVGEAAPAVAAETAQAAVSDAVAKPAAAPETVIEPAAIETPAPVATTEPAAESNATEPTDPKTVPSATEPVVGVTTETPTEKTDVVPASIAAVAEPAASAAAAAAPPTETSKEAPAVTATSTATAAATTNIQKLWEVAQAHVHPEIWGVTLANPALHVPSQIVLQKYLNANDGDFAKAKDQLVKTLDWRQKMKPLELVKKAYPRAKFDGVGYVTSYTAQEMDGDIKGPEAKEVFTWNIYGSVKSIDDTFGNLEEFLEWRVALMELALQQLSLATATERITESKDPYKIYQVHDYKSISFLRAPSSVKAASKGTIAVFATNYPELLKEKFFVNVPAIMGFMYGLMKLFVAAKTLQKFHPMSNGTALAQEFGPAKITTKLNKSLGSQLPSEYGGKGSELSVSGTQTLFE